MSQNAENSRAGLEPMSAWIRKDYSPQLLRRPSGAQKEQRIVETSASLQPSECLNSPDIEYKVICSSKGNQLYDHS